METRSGEFWTTDPGELRQEISPLTPNPPGVEPLGTDFEGAVSWYRLSRVGFFSIRTAPARIFDEADSWGLGLNLPLEGHLAFGRGSAVVETSGDGAFLRRPGDPFELRTFDESSLLVVHVDAGLLASMSEKLGRELRFEPWMSPAEPGRESFSRFLRWSWGELERGAGFLSSAFAREEFENLIVASLMSVAEDVEGKDVDPSIVPTCAWLSRAEDYVEAHLREPISLVELAEVAGVSIRTVSRGFHERHGVGAVAFLKQRRLEAMHRALGAADPESSSVTEIALSQGFTHLGRFAGDYQRRFGELPSKTLSG